ncbi:MAG: hypothetical protein PW734_03645 [Verrucomicrobium sp.]|nr:hypothetical protein [Verrucomicrobium sp.]
MKSALPLLLGCLGALCLAASAQARVGDTRAQLADRWGAGKEIGEQVLYTADRYSVTVTFNAEGEAAMEIFGLRPDATGARPAITPDDCEEFLHQEGRGQPWRKLDLPGAGATWEREDGKVFARFIPGQQAFVVLGMDKMSAAPLPGVNRVAPGQPLPTAPAP